MRISGCISNPCVDIQFDSSLYLLQFFGISWSFFLQLLLVFRSKFQILDSGASRCLVPQNCIGWLRTAQSLSGGHFGACQARLSGIGGAPRLQDDPPAVGSQ